MGEDMNEDLYSPQQKRADAEFIVECVNLLGAEENPTQYLKELQEKAWMYDELNK